VELTLSHNGLADILSITLDPQPEPIILSVAANRLRHGRQIRLVIEGEGQVAKTVTGRAVSKSSSKLTQPPSHQGDTKLITLLADAYEARKLVLSHPDTPLADLAKQQGKCHKQLAKLIEISCLAPDIVTAVLDGKQPESFTVKKLRSTQLPLAWDQQRALLLGMVHL